MEAVNKAGQFEDELVFLRQRVTELEQRVKQTETDLLAMHDGSYDLSGQTPDEVVRKIVQLAQDRLFFDRAGVFLIDRENHCLKGMWGVDKEGCIARIDDILLPLDAPSESISEAALVALGRLPYYLTQDLDGARPRSRERDIGANLAVPMRVGNRIFGVLVADNYFTHQPIPQERVGWLMGLASQGAAALLNVQAFYDIQDAYHELFKEAMAQKMEEALRESERRFRSIIKNVPDIIYRLNREGKITFVSDAIRRYGYDPDELIGKRMLELIHPKDRGMARMRLIDLHDSKQKSDSLEVRLLIPQREEKEMESLEALSLIFSVHVESLFSGADGGEWLGTQGVARDISERKQAEEMLLQSSRLVALGQMAAGMAHELNQPLTAIAVIAEGTQLLMKQGIEIAPEEYLEWSKDLLGQVERMSNLINHLRLFSREHSTEGKEMVALNGVVEAALEMTGTQLKGHRIQLELELSEEMPLILGNQYRLEQVVHNLVANARDALDEKEECYKRLGKTLRDKRLCIRTCYERGENPQLILEIEDTGLGIAPEHRHQLFQPFFTTKEPDKGTGLGLSVSYAVVKDHGGSIECESQKEKGTLFRVRLPVHG